VGGSERSSAPCRSGRSHRPWLRAATARIHCARPRFARRPATHLASMPDRATSSHSISVTRRAPITRSARMLHCRAMPPSTIHSHPTPLGSTPRRSPTDVRRISRERARRAAESAIACTAAATCTGGKWGVKPGRACDPACPSTEPWDGTACSVDTRGSCLYRNGCGQYDSATCNDGAWVVLHMACSAPAPCPPSAPAIASSCWKEELSCGYTNACGSVDSYWCAGGLWFLWPGACADPDCPATPGELDPCSVEGHTCRYPDGGGCELDCTCTGGTFTCTQPPCGAP
jgi:hypothetical protein